MDGVGSFGAGLAGAAFDPVSFIKQPTTILRVLSWVRDRQRTGSVAESSLGLPLGGE
jgi:hypothetical protein